MTNKILASLGLVAALGLTGCGEKAEENNMMVENVEDYSTTDTTNMDMNMTDLNAATDMNAATDANTTDNTTSNETTNSSGY